ncbi:HD domain-containing protein [Pseudoflavonifractor phocaeensis]|nr:HD domain-containing protein [Pseudoflavonifractor phocaeensis]
MYVPPQVNTALDLLAAAGYEAYLVGGAVRDYVRENRQGKDWDITTSALPEEVERVFAGYRLIETGLKHGTVTVVIDGEPLEITTYRVDGSYSDHRRPDSVSFTRSLREDVERRDFTMNALAYNPSAGVVDLVGGVKDIEAKILRCVGDPDRRFQEDALRILRALRFASVLGLEIESATAEAAHKNKALLKEIAAERIQVELTKMLCGEGIQEVLVKYSDILAVVMPELEPMFGFEQQNPHHNSDVWYHTVKVVTNAPAEPVMRWTALLHDVGKPHCFSLDEQGIGHFFGHASKSTVIADELLQRLRFDNATRERITLLVKNHDTPLPSDERGVKRLMNRLGSEAALQIVNIHRADTAGQHPDCAYRYVEFDEVKAMMQKVLDEQACFSVKNLAINGNDVLAKGLRGKQVGEALQRTLNAVMDGEVPNEKNELLIFLDCILDEYMEDYRKMSE